MKTLMFFLIAFLSLQLSGQLMYQSEQIYSLDSISTESDFFGESVAIDGDYAVVGSPYHSYQGVDLAGAAYVFHWNGQNWEFQKKLLAPFHGMGDYFGRSVAIHGDYIIVGAPGNDIGSIYDGGSAHIFQRNGTDWQQVDILTSNDVQDYDNFGISVSIYGDYALVGAFSTDHSGFTDAGSAYIFKKNGSLWYHHTKLNAPDADSYLEFGRAVSIGSEFAIIGDPKNNSGQGAAYIFQLISNTWSFKQKIVSSTGASDDYFGSSVAIQGHYAVVGSFTDRDFGWQVGSAFVFRYSSNQWQQFAQLEPSDGTMDTFFGYSVSISGDKVIVGAPGDLENGLYSGAAYVFHRTDTDYVLDLKIQGSDTTEFDNYGCAVAISNDKGIIGAFGSDKTGPESGSAYMYSFLGSYAIQTCSANDTNPMPFSEQDTEIQFTGNHPETELTVIKFDSQPTIINNLPGGISNISSNRYWQINSNQTGYNYNVTFDLYGVAGIHDFNTLTILKRATSNDAWEDVTKAPHNATLVYDDINMKITVQGLSGFSDFVPAGGADNPLPVVLSSFTAIQFNNHALLTWQTASEVNNSHWNVYRAQGNVFQTAEQVNALPISGAGTSSAETNYEFLDSSELENEQVYFYWLESVNLAGNSEVFEPIEFKANHIPDNIEPPEAPLKYGLHAAYPNPFNPSTTLQFMLPETDFADVFIFDVKGRMVKHLVHHQLYEKDELYSIVWNGSDKDNKPVASGFYLVKLNYGKGFDTRKILLLK